MAQFLGMTAWFSATAVTPALVAELHLTDRGAAWLTMAVQAGFVGGTLLSAAANLADVMNARRLFALGCLVAATANALVARVTDPAAVIALRLLTGAALACVYPPGMKIAAGWFATGRGFALAVVVGALTAGKASPHLFQAILGTDAWQSTLLIASGCTIAGGLVVLLFVRDGPYVSVTSPFDARAAARLFATPGSRQATFGYLGHMWELYGVWTWIAAFAVASLEFAGASDAARGGSLVAFIAIVSGTLGCLVAGWVSDRVGKARVATWSMAVSGACCAVSPLIFGRSPALLLALVTVWGFTVVADSAQFSALVSEHTSRDYVGTALTVQTCLGFLLTMVTIRLLPEVAGVTGWRWAFLLLLPGPALGILAMRPLLEGRAGR